MTAEQRERPEEPEHHDALPADLDASAYVGPYAFPDNARRRVPATLYAAVGLSMSIVALVRGTDAVFVNRGTLIGGVALLLLGAYGWMAAYPLRITQTDALGRAAAGIGFPVGHASAQLAWRGLRSRPTWRILCYSADEPPSQRGLVLVDGVDGLVIDHILEDNPEDWSAYAPSTNPAPQG